jgi:hypothetical protein
MGPTEYCTTILLPKPSHNLSCVLLLEPGILDCRLLWMFSKINSFWCREQLEGWLHFQLCDIQVLWLWHHYLCIWALLSIIRNLAIAALLCMLDSWSSHWTVFVKTGSLRWIFSPAAVVLRLYKTILLKVRWFLHVNVDFRPLFLFADVIFPWFMYADITLETVAIDTPTNAGVFVTDAPAKWAPTICPL